MAAQQTSWAFVVLSGEKNAVWPDSIWTTREGAEARVETLKVLIKASDQPTRYVIPSVCEWAMNTPDEVT